MKRAEWKEEQRALEVRAEIAEAGKVVWHSPSKGTFNDGRNQLKRQRRANSEALRGVVRPAPTVAKPIRPAENKRRRAMTAKRRAARAAL